MEKGHCKHGEFDLMEGCPQCMAEKMAEKYLAQDGIIPGPKVEEPATEQIVKVQYYSETTEELSSTTTHI